MPFASTNRWVISAIASPFRSPVLRSGAPARIMRSGRGRLALARPAPNLPRPRPREKSRIWKRHPPVRKREGRLAPDAVAALNADLAARFGNRFSASRGDPPPARPYADLAREPAAGRGRVRRDARRRDRPRQDLRPTRRADRPVRDRLVARRPRQRAARRRVARLLADERRSSPSTPRTSIASSSPASPAPSSTATCTTAASSSRSTRAPTPPSAAWPRPAPRAPTRCATAR